MVLNLIVVLILGFALGIYAFSVQELTNINVIIMAMLVSFITYYAIEGVSIYLKEVKKDD